LIKCGPNGWCGKDGFCVCKSGFFGSDCSVWFDFCPDGKKRCFNEARCSLEPILKQVEDNHSRDSKYHCDCSHHDGEWTESQIAQCQDPKTEICITAMSPDFDKMRPYAFCMNGGKCNVIVDSWEDHMGCTCPDDFEGRHCQFFKGKAPAIESRISYGTMNDEESRRRIVSAVIVCIVVGGLGLFFFIRSQREKQRLEDIWLAREETRRLQLVSGFNDREEVPLL